MGKRAITSSLKSVQLTQVDSKNQSQDSNLSHFRTNVPQAWKVDFAYVFTYPLTPVPLSLFSPDGTVAKTNKSSLFQELEKRIMPSQSDNIDAAIIDGPFMLHLIAGKQTGTYSQLSRTVLSSAVRLSKTRADTVFDNFKEHSLNDVAETQTTRGTSSQDQCSDVHSN